MVTVKTFVLLLFLFEESTIMLCRPKIEAAENFSGLKCALFIKRFFVLLYINLVNLTN